jgi:hypothetical protein
MPVHSIYCICSTGKFSFLPKYDLDLLNRVSRFCTDARTRHSLTPERRPDNSVLKELRNSKDFKQGGCVL